MSVVVKSGNLLKYTESAFSSKWKYNYVELLKDSSFRWYVNKGDTTPKRSVVLKNVSSFLAFGDIISQLPFKPELKPNEVSLAFAIPHESNRNTRLSFFLCSSQNEVQEWVNCILGTISDQTYPAQASQSTQPPYTGNPVGSNPMYPGSAPGNAAPSAGYNPSYPGGPPPSGCNAPYAGGPPPPYVAGPPNAAPPAIGFNIGNSVPGPMPPGNYQPQMAYPQSQPPACYPQAPVPYQYPSYPTQPPAPRSPYNQPGGYPRQPGYVPGVPYTQGTAVTTNPYGATYVAGQPVPQSNVVIVAGKKKKHKKLKNAAIGLAAGAAGAYAAHKMFGGFGHGWGYGHGWGGGWGMGHRWGSWSSLSSFSSGGSWSD